MDSGDDVDDNEEVNTEFPDNWSIIADKGYSGLREVIRIIVTKKVPSNVYLTTSDKNIIVSYHLIELLLKMFLVGYALLDFFPKTEMGYF